MVKPYISSLETPETTTGADTEPGKSHAIYFNPVTTY